MHDIVHEAIENARFVCEEHYGLFKAPPVQLICSPSLNFAYVPGHLSHICFELLKNSLRAVVERFGPENEESMPPIKVIVSEGREDITIKISDEGGGIPRSAIPLIWTYMYTTMEGQGLDQDFRDSDFKAPMAGFGYGLPLSRLVSAKDCSFPVRLVPSLSCPVPADFLSLATLHPSTFSSALGNTLRAPSVGAIEDRFSEVHKSEAAAEDAITRVHAVSANINCNQILTHTLPSLSQYARYFGGDLKLISMEGYGTDVYIHLNRLSSSREPLQ